MSDLKLRNFQSDFCFPAILGRNKKEAQKIAIALDAAVCFGILEYLDGNESLKDRVVVEAKYWDCVKRLKGL